jgi:hypothetical protein
MNIHRKLEVPTRGTCTAVVLLTTTPVPTSEREGNMTVKPARARRRVRAMHEFFSSKNYEIPRRGAAREPCVDFAVAKNIVSSMHFKIIRSKFTRGGPVKNTSGLAPRRSFLGSPWIYTLQHVADTGQKSDRQKVAMWPNGWLHKIILPAKGLILISSFDLGTILIQFHPPRA